MTYERNLGDPIDATYDSVLDAHGGVIAAAAECGVSGSTMRQWLESRTTTHEINFKRWRKLIRWLRATGVPSWARPLHALCWEFDHVCIPIPVAGPDCSEISLGVVKLAKEFGDVAREAAKAVEDGKISRKEVDRVCREVKELMSALAAFEATVKAAAEKGMR